MRHRRDEGILEMPSRSKRANQEGETKNEQWYSVVKSVRKMINARGWKRERVRICFAEAGARYRQQQHSSGEEDTATLDAHGI